MSAAKMLAALPKLHELMQKSHERNIQRRDAANAATPKTAKLSKVQRAVLTVALRWRGKDYSDIYSSDIKAEVFGLNALHHYPCGWRDESRSVEGTARYADDHHMADRHSGGAIFDVQSIRGQARLQRYLCERLTRPQAAHGKESDLSQRTRLIAYGSRTRDNG